MNKRCEIVIVDDELLIRQGIINYIDWEAEGFKIVGAAANGQEALQIIKRSNPHVIITDVVMPVMDGIELVKVVKEQFPHIEIIVLSSFEDYEYVRSTFQSGVADYILKHQLNGEKLLNTLQQVVTKIPDLQNPNLPNDRKMSIEEIIERMILGSNSDYDEKMIASHFPHSHFMLVAICWKNGEKISNELGAIVEELEKHLMDCVSCVFLQEASGTTILLNIHSSQVANVTQAVRQLSITKDDTKANVNLVLSDPFNAINEIKRVYDESLLKLKQYLFYFPNHSVLTYDLLPKIKKNKKSFDLNHFIKIFKARQFHAAFNYVTEHVNDLSTEYTRDSFEFKSFIGNIMFNIIVLMGNLQFDIETLEKKKYRYFSDVNEAANVHDAVAIYHRFLNEINKIIFAYDNVDGPSDMQAILYYIEEHYAEPLSLAKVAEHFHFNPSYLSFYFNTKHHEGFSEYLNRIRIKKAMDLLKNSQVSISDISGMVGYSGHSYFCKVFKKITGMSPSRYRKEHQI